MHRSGSREAARRALLEHPDWSDRRLEAAGVGYQKIISTVRREMVGSGEIPDIATVLGRDGKWLAVASRRRPPRSPSLLHRLAQLRALARTVGDACFCAAEPATRRHFWIAADRLADEVGRCIDIRTGELMVRSRPSTESPNGPL